MRKTLFFIFVATLSIGWVSPPRTTGDVIPSCTGQQVTLVRSVLSDYMSAYKVISNRVGEISLDDFVAHSDDVDELIADLHELQLKWFTECESQLPRCAVAVEMSHKLGRLLDETLIAVLLLDAGYNSFADWHANPIEELANSIWSFLDARHASIQTDGAIRVHVGMTYTG